jgi:hypothetical protein
MSTAVAEKHSTEERMEVEEVDSQSGNQVTWTAEEEKKLVRKIDLFLMPTIWLMYLLSYMVRSVPVLGLEQQLTISGPNQYWQREDCGNGR